MGRFLAVNGALFVLAALFFLTVMATAVSRCSPYLHRRTKESFVEVAGKRPGLRAARREAFLEHKAMANSSLKSILIIDEEPAVLEFLSAELRHAYPDLRLQTARTYREATTLLCSWTYDLVIFDITGARGLDLLTQTRDRPYPIPAVTFNTEALPPAALERALALGAFLCPSREIGPFLDGIMKGKQEAVWRRMLHPVRRRVRFPVGFTHGGYSGVATR